MQVLWNKVNWLISTINLSPWAFSGAMQGGLLQGGASGEVAKELVSHDKHTSTDHLTLTFVLALYSSVAACHETQCRALVIF